MSAIIDIVRRVVEEEMGRTRTSLLGVVTAVFPHEGKDDENNYEVGVKLKHEGLELRRVPVAVTHVGVASPPRAGDLVLVQFVGGDLNQPVIVGRLYHAKERPPLHKEEEVLFEHRVSDGTLNHLRFAADGSIFLQRDVTKPEDNSKAKTSIRIDGASGDLEIKVGDDVMLEMKSAKITIKGDMEITGNVKMKGDLEVSSNAGKTTISGNSIEGGVMADLLLKGTLDFRGMVALKASGGKVKAGGLEVLVEQASGTAAAPVVLPPPPASPATVSVAVKVIVSLNKTVTAGGKAIVTQGMCLQGDMWPGFVMRGSGTVTVNHIPMNVQNEQATIFPSGAPATFNSSGQ